MSWEPLSREELEQMMSSALASADDSVRAAWARIRIPPEKWRCSPWGDEGGGFWVVALCDTSAVWYNDIEDGFNVSAFSSRGLIDEYRCDQTSFEEFLGSLPEATIAERFAEQRPAALVPGELKGPGRIERRQTTYWELRTATGACWRVHFSGKKEARFAHPDYEAVELVGRHPLLLDYGERWAELYVASAAHDPAGALKMLESCIAAETGGWRTLAHYRGGAGAPEKVLESGYGLLLRAPRVIVAAAQAVMRGGGVDTSIVGDWPSAEGDRVLLLGEGNVVVARAFRFEPLKAPPSEAGRHG